MEVPNAALLKGRSKPGFGKQGRVQNRIIINRIPNPINNSINPIEYKQETLEVHDSIQTHQ